MNIASSCDVAVVGAGAAGLAAAAECARCGLSAVVFDEQQAAGGQIYRAITTTPLKDRAVLGADYWHGEGLVGEFARAGAMHVPVPVDIQTLSTTYSNGLLEVRLKRKFDQAQRRSIEVE